MAGPLKNASSLVLTFGIVLLVSHAGPEKDCFPLKDTSLSEPLLTKILESHFFPLKYIEVLHSYMYGRPIRPKCNNVNDSIPTLA